MWSLISTLSWPQRLRLPLLRDPCVHHRLLDNIVGRLRGSLPTPFFADGWGNLDVPQKFLHWLKLQEKAREMNGDATRSLITKRSHIQLTPVKQKRFNSVHLFEGEFNSPVPETFDLLPPESKKSRFLFVIPNHNHGWQDSNSSFPSFNITGISQIEQGSFSSNFPVVLVLPGTGDHGYSRRLQCVSLPLAKKGISSIILESPFYGSRKPKGQFGSKLKRVSDLPILGRATIEESIAVLSWLQERDYGPLVITGVSMGGLHAAMVASLLPFETGVVSWCAPPSAGPVFSEWLLGNFCAWKSLQKDSERLDVSSHLGMFLPNPNHPIDKKSARELMGLFLKITDIENFPSPVAPKNIIIYLAKNDLFVHFESAVSRWIELQQNKWKGAEIRWTDGGHVSESLFSQREMVRCITQLTMEMSKQNSMCSPFSLG